MTHNMTDSEQDPKLEIAKQEQLKALIDRCNQAWLEMDKTVTILGQLREDKSAMELEAASGMPEEVSLKAYQQLNRRISEANQQYLQRSKETLQLLDQIGKLGGADEVSKMILLHRKVENSH